MKTEVTREKIAELKAQAVERNLPRKVYTVCEELGEWESKGHGYNITYAEHEISLYADSYATNCHVEWNDERVFTVHLGDVEAYRPNVEGWENALEELYKVASERVALKQTDKKANEAKELASRWG